MRQCNFSHLRPTLGAALSLLLLTGLLFLAGCVQHSDSTTTAQPSATATATPGGNGFVALNKKDGLALAGYDAVAYFIESQPVKGRAEFSHNYNGGQWLFASAASRDAFAREPQKYAPQYGGYCSYAVSRGYTANGDPQAWRIVDGKLYLNYSLDVREMWAQDISGNINQGNQNWSQFFVKKPPHKG